MKRRTAAVNKYTHRTTTVISEKEGRPRTFEEHQVVQFSKILITAYIKYKVEKVCGKANGQKYV